MPLAQDSGAPPTGSRITLVFEENVPDLNGEQLEALLKPMIDFGVKSPAEAFAESLPPFLRKAVEEHRILVGMDRDLVIYSKNQPTRKIRETDEGKPVEIWIYGEAPQPVEFVYFQGSYVTRIQLAKVGEPMEERTENEMGDYFGNLPVVAKNQHEVKLGDATDADRTEENAPKAAPTLRKPGEQIPADNDKDNPRPVMAPVKMPPDLQRPGDPGYTPTVSAKPTQGTQTPAQGTQTSGSTQNTQQSGNKSGNAQPTSDNSAQPQGSPQNSSQQPQSPDPQTNPLDKPQWSWLAAF